MEALASGGRLLFSERIHFCACLRLVFSTSSRSHWSLVGECFAAMRLWWMLCRHHCWFEFSSDRCFAVAVGGSGGCFTTLFVLQIFAPLEV